MTPEQFAYWLQGFAEVHGEPPTAEQWQVVKDHLDTVFVRVTPNRRADEGTRQAEAAEILRQLKPSSGGWVGGAADTSVRTFC